MLWLALPAVIPILADCCASRLLLMHPLFCIPRHHKASLQQHAGLGLWQLPVWQALCGLSRQVPWQPAGGHSCYNGWALGEVCVLKSQVAANNRGIQLVGALIKEYGLSVVHAYMGFIQASVHV